MQFLRRFVSKLNWMESRNRCGLETSKFCGKSIWKDEEDLSIAIIKYI